MVYKVRSDVRSDDGHAGVLDQQGYYEVVPTVQNLSVII